MKTKTILALIVLLAIPNLYYTQSNLNHPTISKVKIDYKSVPQTTNNSFDIQVIPQSTINLISKLNVSKINFKILNPQTHTVLYQKSYSINSSVVIDNEGKKLFENNEGVLFISSGEPILLLPYEYQITTEDNQELLSPVYSSIE